MLSASTGYPVVRKTAQHASALAELEFAMHKALDAGIAPARILARPTHDEPLDVDLRTRSAGLATIEERPFPRHALPMPAQEYRRTDNRVELPERHASHIFV